MQSFWYKRKRKSRKIDVRSPTVVMLTVAEHQTLGGKHSETEIWWLEKVQYLLKKYHCQWTFFREKNPSEFFRVFAIESMPVSRERMVPAKWQVRKILANCTSKAKVITIQAPQNRQHAFFGDFLYCAKLSVQEEAALATNWIDIRPEG